MQDVDWKDDLTFATCSTDKAIHTCVVGEEYPRQTFTGVIRMYLHVDNLHRREIILLVTQYIPWQTQL